MLGIVKMDPADKIHIIQLSVYSESGKWLDFDFFIIQKDIERRNLLKNR